MRGVAAIEMKIDVDVVFLGELENAPDLRRAVGVVTRRAADHRCSALQRRAHDVLRARHVGPAFLQKNTDLEVHAPGVILRQALDRVETAQPDVGVDLDVGAHMGYAVEHALLERRAGARVDVLFGERMLHCGGALHVVGRATVRQRRDAVEYARLVEVEVAFHQPGRHEIPASVHAGAVAGDARRDGCDAAVRDCDVHGRAVPQAGVA